MFKNNMSLMNYKYLSNWLLIKIIVSYSAKKEKITNNNLYNHPN